MEEEYWIKDFKRSIESAMETLNRGNEGDCKNALIMIDNATEKLMKHFITFEKNKDAETRFPELLKQIENEKVSQDILTKISYFHGIRNGLYHSDFKPLAKTMRKPIGLTVEKSIVEEQLNFVNSLFQSLSGGDSIDGD